MRVGSEDVQGAQDYAGFLSASLALDMATVPFVRFWEFTGAAAAAWTLPPRATWVNRYLSVKNLAAVAATLTLSTAGGDGAIIVGNSSLAPAASFALAAGASATFQATADAVLIVENWVPSP